MDSKVDLTKGSVSNPFDKLVEVKVSWWELVVLLYVLAVVLDYHIPFFHDLFVQLLMLTHLDMLLLHMDGP